MQKIEKTQLIERLSELLLSEEKSQPSETKALLSTILTKLDDVSARLGKIENELHERQNDRNSVNFSSAHPSLQQFEIPEAAEQFLPGTTIKACAFEPNGKPCDNCAMCSARGF